MHKNISQYLNRIQEGLFPGFKEELGPTSDKHCQLMVILDIVRVEDFIFQDPYPLRPGRPELDRTCYARAYVAKAVFNIPTTVSLIDRLKVDKVLRRICGWESGKRIGCEATFSNVFAEFAGSKLAERVHGELIKEELKEDLVFHISRDSTAIEAREKPEKKELKSGSTKKKRRRGRPKKGEIVEPKELPRLMRQKQMTVEEMINDLPTSCSYGVKKNAQGYTHSWNGYKLHIDTGDGGIPISCILTGASVHDSSVSLPLEGLTSKRVRSCYSLMDAAYDAHEIREDVRLKGKVAIIDSNPRGGEKVEFSIVERERYKNRTAAERANARLKDDFGARFVRVKGAVKVMSHLMFGVLALTAEQLLRTSG